MFDTSITKDPALSLLFALLALTIFALSVTHYWFGYLNILFINLICGAIFSFSSFFLYLSQGKHYGRYISILTLSTVALLIQYQLILEPELSIHWVYIFPILAHFSLPLSWAIAFNSAILMITFLQLFYTQELTEALRFGLVFILMVTCSFCYVYLNLSKQNRLIELAVTDYKSGAYNSKHLLNILHQEIARSQVTHHTLSLLAITIDDYQQILDIHGNKNSDLVLKGFSNKLSLLLRAGDVIFHNDHGTFYILLPNCPQEGVIILKERLLHKFDKIQWGEVGELQLNIGIATFTKYETADSFLQRASDHVLKQQQAALRLMAFN